MVAGDQYDPNYATKSEILDLSEKKKFLCPNWVEFPFNTFIATGGLVKGIPVICGGYYSGNPYNECYKFIENKAVLLEKMKTKGEGEASVVINNNMLWMTGGYNGSYLSLTDFLYLDGTVSKGNSGCRCSKMINPTLSNSLTLKYHKVCYELAILIQIIFYNLLSF